MKNTKNATLPRFAMPVSNVVPRKDRTILPVSPRASRNAFAVLAIAMYDAQQQGRELHGTIRAEGMVVGDEFAAGTPCRVCAKAGKLSLPAGLREIPGDDSALYQRFAACVHRTRVAMQ